MLAVLPLLAAVGGGLKAVFVVNLVLAMPLPWVVRQLVSAQPSAPRPDDHGDHGKANRRNPLGRAGLLVAAVTVFNAATGGLWTFIGEFAGLAAVSALRLASVLSLATLTGIAATVLAGFVSRRGSRTAWLLCGLLGIATGTTLLHRSNQEVGFALGCLLVSLAWNFSVPCLLSLCADRDDGVALMPAVNFAFAFGLASGPSIAAWAFEMRGVSGLLEFVLVALGLTAALLVAARRGETQDDVSP